MQGLKKQNPHGRIPEFHRNLTRIHSSLQENKKKIPAVGNRYLSNVCFPSALAQLVLIKKNVELIKSHYSESHEYLLRLYCELSCVSSAVLAAAHYIITTLIVSVFSAAFPTIDSQPRNLKKKQNTFEFKVNRCVYSTFQDTLYTQIYIYVCIFICIYIYIYIMCKGF